MKKRYAGMLIMLILLLIALPGRIFASPHTFIAGSGVKGLVDGKAVCGKTISFDPEALFNNEMMDLYSEGNDYRFEIDSNVLEVFYPEVDPDGIYRLNIPVNKGVAGGSFKIEIIFGDYSNEICFESESFDIVGDLSKHGDVLDYDETRIYNGKPKTQPVAVFYDSIGIDEGKDYTVSYTNNINAGTATVTINGKGGYIGSMTRTFQIEKADISSTVIGGITDKNYTGNEITQPVTVKADGEKLAIDKDYTISYKNNKNVGTASLTITGKDNCKGSVTKTFQINKAPNLMTVRKKTVKVKASKLRKKKQVIRCSRSMGICTAVGKLDFKLEKVNKKKFKKYFKVNGLNGNITLRRGLPRGTYKLKINVSASGNANYLAASKTVTVTIKVK